MIMHKFPGFLPLLCFCIVFTMPTEGEPQIGEIFFMDDMALNNQSNETTTNNPNMTTLTITTTESTEEDEGTKIPLTPWYAFSRQIFREVERLPNDTFSLFGVDCVIEHYASFSPVYTMAHPFYSKDDLSNTRETLLRHDKLQYFLRNPEGSRNAGMRKVWLENQGDENWILAEKKSKGRALQEAICYSDGNELLECDSSGTCACATSGTLSQLRLKRMRKNKVSNLTACYSLDCGYCLMRSKVTCGHYGTCREAAVVREWPFIHLNGSCRDSILMLNSQLPHDQGLLIRGDKFALFLMIFMIFSYQLTFVENFKVFHYIRIAF